MCGCHPRLQPRPSPFPHLRPLCQRPRQLVQRRHTLERAAVAPVPAAVAAAAVRPVPIAAVRPIPVAAVAAVGRATAVAGSAATAQVLLGDRLSDRARARQDTVYTLDTASQGCIAAAGMCSDHAGGTCAKAISCLGFVLWTSARPRL